MTRILLALIGAFALGLGCWGYMDMVNAAAEPEAPTIYVTAMRSLAVAKVAFAALILAVCLGFEGIISLLADMRRRHPGIQPPTLGEWVDRLMKRLGIE
jgi:hypothetical protein